MYARGSFGIVSYLQTGAILGGRREDLPRSIANRVQVQSRRQLRATQRIQQILQENQTDTNKYHITSMLANPAHSRDKCQCLSTSFNFTCLFAKINRGTPLNLS